MVWTDPSSAIPGSGLDKATIDVTDAVIPGVDVDRIEVLAGNRVRYHYADDGDRLPYGPITVQLVDAAIRDWAENPSPAATFSYARIESTCRWHNAPVPTDVTHNGQTSALDALRVINELSRRTGQGIDTSLAVPPPANESFDFYDVTCDNEITALDALRVINFLVRQGAIS